MTTDKRFALSGIQAWPTMFFTRLWNLHSDEREQILGLVERLKQTQGRRIDSEVAVGSKSAQGLHESKFDLFSEQQESLQRLVRFIDASLKLAVCIANHTNLLPDCIQVRFVDSWYHVANEGGFHDAHVHHGCSWCGIYYLQIGESGQQPDRSAPLGGSRFYCPFNLGGGYRDFGNAYLSPSIDPCIEDGMLLLFPSYLLHSGLPYRGEKDRIVIAFNAQLSLNPIS
jgi:hypothetical protein